MRFFKWIGIIAAILLLFSVFMNWVKIESPGIVISGMNAGVTNFGKPGLLHLLLLPFFLFFHFMPKVWAKRGNLAVVALNSAWAIRNYVLLTNCVAGECPIAQAGLCCMLIASLLMLLSALFPDVKPRQLQ